jgi:hypothetical protein
VRQAQVSGNPFATANRLWFRDGRTAAALHAYVEARVVDPTDPRVAFQVARVVWSADRFDEARLLLEQANVARDRLTDTGRMVLDHWRLRLAGRPPLRRFPEWPWPLLDRDRLESYPVDDWRVVAEAAADREMFGVALYAMRRWGREPADADEAEELARMERARDADEAVLGTMLATRRTARPGPRPAFPGGGRRTVPGPGISAAPPPGGGPSPAPLPPRQPEPHTAAGPAPVPDLPDLPDLPALPLALDVRVAPADGPVGTPATLVATLSNPTSTPQPVNRRMLVDHPGGDGEVWLQVRGPDGYRNTRGFRVNAGPAPGEFLVDLRPGGSVEQSWALDDYESLHVAGEYEVTVTYHDDRGKVAGTTRFRRG